METSNSDVLHFLQQKELAKLMDEEVILQTYNSSSNELYRWKEDVEKLLAYLKKKNNFN